MPTLVLDVGRLKNTVQLEAWPFCIDMISDIENEFAGHNASQWLFNLYDNVMRIFIHLSEEIVEGSNHDEVEQQADLFPNVAIELVIDPTDFEAFFEKVGENPSSSLFEKFLEGFQSAKSSEEKQDNLTTFKKGLQEVGSE
jgi:hypothetical protein